MARVVVNCGIVPFKAGGVEDGVITFGKHAGQKLGDSEVTWRYLAWVYAWLESHNLPDYLAPVLELVWYWGDRKYDEDAHDGEDKTFDEFLDEARMRMDEGFEGDRAYEESGWQLTYDYVPERDEWVTISVAEKRRRERESAKARADAVLAEGESVAE